MTDSESPWGSASNKRSRGSEDFPVFRRIFRLLVGIAFIAPAVAAVLNWLMVDKFGGETWSVGLTIGVLIALIAVVLVWMITKRLQKPLEDLLRSLNRVAEGHYDERFNQDGGEELFKLTDAFNNLTTSLLVAREAMVDRDLLQQVLDGIPDPLVVLDGNGVVELSNQRFNQELHFDEDIALLGRGVGTLSGKSMPSWYMKLIRHGSLEGERVRFKTKQNEPISMLVSGTMIRDPNKESTRVVLLARSTQTANILGNISAKSEDNDDSTMAEFQNLFDAIEDPITVLGLNGEILQANRAARSMFGSQVVGQKCYRAFRMRDSMCEQCPAKMTYEKKKSSFVEHRIFGNAITRINTYPLFDSDGEVRAIINHKRDVTMERQLEDLKANFLAGVSHELRTPLTSIIGFNKLNLKRMARHLAPHLESSPHKVRITFRQIMDDMEVMVAESERLGRLVNDILDLSKLEAGRMDLDFREIDIGQVIQSAIASTSALWREKGLRVQANQSRNTPKCWGDSDRLIQILMNLLSNAIKFTDVGDIAITTSVSRWHVCVSVKDSGAGIPLEEQKTIFEKFRQTAEGNRRGGGTGLGLPICRELIQLHRGKLWVDSIPGEGATFSFTILRSDRKHEVTKDQEVITSFSGQWKRSDLDLGD